MVVGTAECKRLVEQEPGHADQGNCKKNKLHRPLSRVELVIDGSRGQEHVDEHVQKRRSNALQANPVHAPLVDDGEAEVAEDAVHEEEARDVVADDVDAGLEEAEVGERQLQGVGHVDEAHEDGELHLVGVGEEQGVLCGVPCPV